MGYLDFNCMNLKRRAIHNDPSIEDWERAGRPAKLEPYLERRIVRLIKNRLFDPASNWPEKSIQDFWKKKKSSIQTFKKIACKKDLPAQRPSHKPISEPRHITSRYEFTKEYRNKDLRFWRNIYFADEVSLEL